MDYNDLIYESEIECWLKWSILEEEFWLEEYNPSDYINWYKYSNPVNE